MAKSKTKGPRQKQRANVYTMMLIVAFLALSVGSFILWKQLDKYGWDREAKEGLPRAAVMTAAGLV